MQLALRDLGSPIWTSSLADRIRKKAFDPALRNFTNGTRLVRRVPYP